jgi:uncharacterized membrane protein
MSGSSAVERVVARALLWGGLLSVSLMVGGLAVYAVQGQPQARDVVRVVRNRQAGRAVDVFASLGDVRRALTRRPPDALAIATLGLVCLLATPVAGVALASLSFWRHGDRQYAVIAAAVLALLLASLALATGG